MTNTIEILQQALPNYAGLTRSEKKFGLSNLTEWIPSNGHLETFINKFSEKSLDMRPFLKELGLLK
jgi:hypothetical protein